MTGHAVGITKHLGIRYATAARFDSPTLVPFDSAAGTWGHAGSMSPQIPG